MLTKEGGVQETLISSNLAWLYGGSVEFILFTATNIKRNFTLQLVKL